MSVHSACAMHACSSVYVTGGWTRSRAHKKWAPACCPKCKSRSKALKTVLNVKASWNPWEKKIQHHIPPVHPSYFLQIEKTRFSEWQQQKQYLSIAVGFFRWYNSTSTRFISVPALDLALVHKRKHFSYQLHSQMAFLWTRGSIIAYQGHVTINSVRKCASCPT